MLKIIKQNQNVILVSVGLFMVSMTILLFLVNNSDKGGQGELKADVVSASEVNSEKSEESVYRKLINNQDDPIIVLRIDGTIEFASPDLKISEGYDPAKLQDKLFYSLLNPEDLSIFLGAYGKAMLSEQAVMMIGPYRIRSASGEYSINMGSLYPIKDGDKVQKIILTTRNISTDLNKTKTVDPEDNNVEPEDSQTAAEADTGSGSDIEAASGDDSALLKSDIFESTSDSSEDHLTQEKSSDRVIAPVKSKYIRQKTGKASPAKVKDNSENSSDSPVKYSDIFDTSQNPKKNEKAKDSEAGSSGDFNYKNSKIFSHKLTFKP